MKLPLQYYKNNLIGTINLLEVWVSSKNAICVLNGYIGDCMLFSVLFAGYESCELL